MVEKVKHVVWHTSKFSIKLLGVFFVLVLMMMGWFVWRVSDRPLDVSFVKGTIEAAMYDPASGRYARMGRAVLFWPDLKGPLYLQIHDGQFFNKQGVVIGSIRQLDVSFSRTGLLFGRIMPKAVILKQPLVRLTRLEDGEFSFDIGARAGQDLQPDKKPGAEGLSSDAVMEMISYIARPESEDKEGSDSLFLQLRGFSIEGARLLIDDKVIQQTWSLPDFDLEFLSVPEGAQGNINMTLPGTGLEDSALDIALDYNWAQGRIALKADVEDLHVNDIIGKIPSLDIPAAQEMVVDAHIETLLDDTSFLPSDVRIDVRSAGGKIVHPKLSEDALSYENLAFNATYNYSGKSLQLRDTHVSLGGITFEFSGTLTHDSKSVRGPVRVWAKDVEQAKIDGIWPKFLRGEDAEKWIVHRMDDGVFEEISASLDFLAERQRGGDSLTDIEPQAGVVGEMSASEEVIVNEFEDDAVVFDLAQGVIVSKEEADLQEGEDVLLSDNQEDDREFFWLIDIQNVLVDFKARDMTLDYHAPLPKASGLKGSGRFDVSKDTLSIDIESAKIDGMDVGKSTLFFDELVAEGVGDADLRFELNGKISEVLRYISNEPINLGDDIAMDINEVKGNADLDIWLNFPARGDVKLNQFKIDIGGTLSDVLFPGVVRDLDISGGPLELSVKDNKVRVEGAALLDGRQTDLSWEAFLKSEGQPYEEKIQANLQVDDDLRAKLGIDLTEFLEGVIDTALTYTVYQDGTAVADVKADLTPAKFFVDSFDYEKSEGQGGQANFEALFDRGTLIKVHNLRGQTPDFTLEGGTLDFISVPVSGEEGEMQVFLFGGQIDAFTLGETQAALEFSYDEMRAVDIKMEAAFLDARPFLNAEEQGQVDGQPVAYDFPPMRIGVQADSVRTAPQKTAQDVRIDMEIDGQGRFDRMDMDGRIGSSNVLVRFNDAGDKDGGRTFRLRTKDAGALLSAFGVYNNLVGGAMVIYGEPMRWIYDRNIRGRAEITDFKVVKAPALAQILSLMSLGGIRDLLTAGGLNFKKMDVEFDWLYSKGGSVLEMKNGRTSGNTLGILFEGRFDNRKREVDVSGTVAPMDQLNRFIDKIPLVGRLLTGGEGGGVFAATYSIRGFSENPQVLVNPLSVLTPGILRRILWE
ncbi:MAG: DUF3971 domain-containing protein [Alphaproteobacteria bacterium]